MKNKKSKTITSHGFTLIELLTVIGIISLLFAFMLSFINPAMQLKKGRDGVRKSDLRQIQAALEMYRADIGSYPAAVSNALNPNCGTTSLGNASCMVIYLQKIPKDPKTDGNYIYKSESPGTNYCIRTCLENTNDQQKDTTNDYTPCQTYAYAATCGPGSKWSYTLMNP